MTTEEKRSPFLPPGVSPLLEALGLLDRLLAVSALEFGECACVIEGPMARSDVAMDCCLPDQQGCIIGDARDLIQRCREQAEGGKPEKDPNRENADRMRWLTECDYQGRNLNDWRLVRDEARHITNGVRSERLFGAFSRGSEVVNAINGVWDKNGKLPAGSNAAVANNIEAVCLEFDLNTQEWHYWCQQANPTPSSRDAGEANTNTKTGAE